MKLADDISKLTTIPIDEVEQILNCIKDCVCYNIQESIKNKEDFIDVDIGIGCLSLGVGEDTIEYKFIPSDSLEDDVKYTLKNGYCPLISKVENCIRNKIVGAYKEFF